MENMTEIEPIALFDLDGTLCDHDKGLYQALESIKSPNEPSYRNLFDESIPEYIKRRADIIRTPSSWWRNLEKFQLGWDVLEVAKSLDFNIMVLTQGPKKFPDSWKGKKEWVDKHLGSEIDITITRDKGTVYGKVLVDDFPGYVERWLSWRDRGLVIMPANEGNKNFSHPQVIRYDGLNLDVVKKAMEKARYRKRGEKINFLD